MDNLISVIIPVYNRENFIRRAIESVISQDHPAKEIIVIDDGSSDKSALIAEQTLASANVSYRIIRLTKNSGVSHARNVGIKESKGTYVSFLDSDDSCDAMMLSAMFAQAVKGDIADLVFCGYRKVHIDNNVTEVCALNDKLIAGIPVADIAISRIFNRFEPALSSLFKRDLLIQNHIFFNENCYAGEDGEFFLKAIVRSKKIAAIPSAPYVYVQHETMGINESDSQKNVDRYRSNTLALMRTAKYIMEYSDNSRLCKVAAYYLLPLVLQRYISYAAMRGNSDIFYRMLKNTQCRRKMLSSYHMLFIKPEIFFKSLALLAFPEKYYRHYSKKYR